MSDPDATRVAVVGAGAVGVTAARDLAERDAAVDLYDRGKLGGGSTERAAGIVYDAFAEDVDVEVAARSMERFRALSGTGDFRLSTTPYLWFCTDEGDAETLRSQVRGMRRHDRDVELVDTDRVRREFPVLRVSDLAAAAVARTAGVADPLAYVEAVATAARDAGATLHLDTPASVALDPPRVNGEAYDAVVVTAGAWTPRVLAEAGVSVPVAAYRVQAAVLDGPAVPIFYDATAGYYVSPHALGLLAGDGVDGRPADPDGFDGSADDEFVAATRDRLERRLVNADLPVERSWAGVCTATPDRDPLVGELEDGLYVGVGWHGHGFMRAPAVGERLAQQVLGERAGLAPFDPTRFDGDERIDLPGADAGERD